MKRVLTFIALIVCLLIMAFCCFMIYAYMFPMKVFPGLSSDVTITEYKPKMGDIKYKVPGGSIWIDRENGTVLGYKGAIVELEIPSEVKGVKVTSIGESAFVGCDILKRVVIPEGIVTIENYGFNGCRKLVDISISDSVKSIGKGGFSMCENLVSLEIPDSVEYLGPDVFTYDWVLTDLKISDDNQFYKVVDGVVFNKEETCLHTFLFSKSDKSYVIPDTVERIEAHAFDFNNSLESLTIPKSVVFIGESAFRYCNSINDFYYEGTEEEWELIDVEIGNDDLWYGNVHFMGEEK